jgi:hypothetical protein
MNQTRTPQEHLERWRKSGFSQKEYCRQNNVNANTFAYWRSRSQAKAADDQSWVRVKTHPSTISGMTEYLEVRINLGIFRLEYRRARP